MSNAFASEMEAKQPAVTSAIPPTERGWQVPTGRRWGWEIGSLRRPCITRGQPAVAVGAGPRAPADRAPAQH
jgi:hypothetical protein